LPVWWAGTVSAVGATTVHLTKMQLLIQKGRASNNKVTHLVVTLYEHGLLSEGLSKYLPDHTGVAATIVYWEQHRPLRTTEPDCGCLWRSTWRSTLVISSLRDR
jgi:hypothetical protein